MFQDTKNRHYDVGLKEEVRIFDQEEETNEILPHEPTGAYIRRNIDIEGSGVGISKISGD